MTLCACVGADNRTFKYCVSQFGTMCLLQDAHINMPFQSWELRPHKANAAVLTIIAAIVELEIEIKVGLASVVLSWESVCGEGGGGAEQEGGKGKKGKGRGQGVCACMCVSVWIDREKV